MDQEVDFILDDDERAYLAHLLPENIELLHLLNEGAKIAGNLARLEESRAANIYDADLACAMLVSKSSEVVRFGVNGLLFGYYLGVALVLRPAYEALALAYLFRRDPSEVSSWAADGRQPKRTDEERGQLARRQNARRNRAYEVFRKRTSYESERLRRLVTLKKWSQDHIHSSFESLLAGYWTEVDGLLDGTDTTEPAHAIENHDVSLDDILLNVTVLVEALAEFAAEELDTGREWINTYDEWRRSMDRLATT